MNHVFRCVMTSSGYARLATATWLRAMGSHKQIADAEDAAREPSASSISCARVSMPALLPSTCPYVPSMSDTSAVRSPMRHIIDITRFENVSPTGRPGYGDGKWEIPPMVRRRARFLR